MTSKYTEPKPCPVCSPTTPIPATRFGVRSGLTTGWLESWCLKCKAAVRREMRFSAYLVKQEEKLLANGKHCRSCAHAKNRDVMEPQCTKYRMPVKGISIPRFCTIVRTDTNACGPEAKGFELYTEPKSVYTGPKGSCND